MRFAPSALAAVAVLATSACTPGVSTVGQQHPPFRTAHSNYALNGRDVYVIVQGGGYGVDQASFRQAVLNNMQRARGGLNTRFTSNPTVNYNSDYKVVMLFNGPTSAQPDDLCRRPDQFAAVTPIASAETHVLAAFCRFDSPLTEVSGRAAGVTAVTDARFASLIRQTVGDLFPPTDDRPQEDSDDGGDNIP
jgi:hypothetical protein